MFQQQTSCFLILASAIFMSLMVNSQADADNCGGTTPCSCGDNVTTNRKLTATDPVVVNACIGNGLIMNIPGVVLNLNGQVVRGQGNGVGILIQNVDGVTIEAGKGGQVDNFQTGIGTAPGTTTTGSLIKGVKSNANIGDGVYLEGDGNDILDFLAKRNGGQGVTVIGNNNLLQNHNNEYGGHHGIFVQGDFNQLIGNFASENANEGPGAGIRLEGNHNTLLRNRMTKLNDIGIDVVGNNNTLDENLVRKQKGDGILVAGDDNVLTDNRLTDNRGTGIRVTGSGDPADSTGNILSKNKIKPQCLIYDVTTPPTCNVK